ncbi:MAG TPA: beta-galactosidase [Lentisphaeria bacterium]|nr:beta-galactosidase [Lentisphaeria bacterium]
MEGHACHDRFLSFEIASYNKNTEKDIMKAFPQYSKRHFEILDGAWDFCFLGESVDLDSVNLKKAAYNELMPVPGVFDATPKYPGMRGTALYRCKVAAAPNSRMKLRLGGIGLWSRIYWDGNEVGTIDLPYSGVEIDFLSGKGKEHELVILIDNRLDFKRCPLFSQYYDFYGFGGIYRTVELHQLPECNINRARVRPLDIKTGLVSIDIELSGKIPARFAFNLAFDGGKEEGFCETVKDGHASIKLKVPKFKLWSPEKPNLHTVTISTIDDGITERFGIREVTAEKGQIKVNGKPQKLLGYCRHESHMEFGPVQPLPLLFEDLQYLKDLGCNFVRGTHYPQDQRFLDLCDQLGFMVWEESMGWNNSPEHFADKGFFDAQVRQTQLLVRNSFNHPSVIIWGFLNEGNSETRSCEKMYRTLFKTIRGEDSSRLVTYASNRAERDLFFEMSDIISLNTYPGWYAKDREKARPLDEIVPCFDNFIRGMDKRGLKDKPFIISEIGAGAIYGWHDRFRVHWSEEYQADYLEIAANYAVRNPRVTGISIWHFADARTYTSSYALGRPRTINDKGTLDEFRRPKMAYDIVKRAFRKK